jgi:hypothetical protein
MPPTFERYLLSNETVLIIFSRRQYHEFEWVRNSYDSNNISRLTTYKQLQLIDIFCDDSVKDI